MNTVKEKMMGTTNVKRRGKSPLAVSGKLTASERKILEAALSETKPRKLREDANVVALSQKELEALFEVQVQNAAELIRTAKEKRKVSQRDLASRVGVANPRVAQIQKAGNAIEIPTLAKYAEALGYDLEIAFVPRQGGERLVTKAPAFSK
jgi:ribosome-binding protein aMBF1 (putative translation factor)